MFKCLLSPEHTSIKLDSTPFDGLWFCRLKEGYDKRPKKMCFVDVTLPKSFSRYDLFFQQKRHREIIGMHEVNLETIAKSIWRSIQ